MNIIEQIYYNDVKLHPSYFEKYKKVPEYPGQKESGGWNKHNGWRGHDFPRVWCILDFIEWTSQIELSGHIGVTDDEDPELEFVENRFSKKTVLSYPPYDLHEEIKTDENFDFFLFSQTIEHLYNPYLAIRNIRNVMKPSGLVFTSVPTINIPHMTPVHFGGYTPMGLASMFILNGFQVVKMGQWGNHDYISKIFEKHTWPDFYELANENGEVTNEERNCSQCWILARAI